MPSRTARLSADPRGGHVGTRVATGRGVVRQVAPPGALALVPRCKGCVLATARMDEHGTSCPRRTAVIVRATDSAVPSPPCADRRRPTASASPRRPVPATRRSRSTIATRTPCWWPSPCRRRPPTRRSTRSRPRCSPRPPRRSGWRRSSPTEILAHIREVGLAPTKAKQPVDGRQPDLDAGGEVVADWDFLESLRRRRPQDGERRDVAGLRRAGLRRRHPHPSPRRALGAVERVERGDAPSATSRRVFPRSTWNRRHLQIIYFGREYCPALRHDFTACPICSFAASKRQIDAERRRPRPDSTDRGPIRSARWLAGSTRSASSARAPGAAHRRTGAAAHRRPPARPDRDGPAPGAAAGRPDRGRGAAAPTWCCGAGSGRRTDRTTCRPRSPNAAGRAGQDDPAGRGPRAVPRRDGRLAGRGDRLRDWQEDARDWVEANDACRRDILDRLAADGPAPSRDLPDTCVVPWRSSGLEQPSQRQPMLELLAPRGEVAVVRPAGPRAAVGPRRPGLPARRRVPPPRSAARPRRTPARARSASPAPGPESPVEPPTSARPANPPWSRASRGDWRVDPAQLDATSRSRAAPRCCRRSTGWSSTASGWPSCSSSTTSWRCTSRPPSGAGATGRCRSSTATDWSASSTPPPTARPGAARRRRPRRRRLTPGARGGDRRRDRRPGRLARARPRTRRLNG